MCRLSLLCLACCLTPGLAIAQAANATDARCVALQSVVLDHAKVVSATVTTPAATIPEAKLTPAQIAALPSFCRIKIEDYPSTDSDIKTEVWLPLFGWNGSLRGQGNGGFAGDIYYPQMAYSVTQQYATVGTDTGHTSGAPIFALGHPEKIKDFGWRAIHDMTAEARQIVAAFYTTPLKHAYFIGCSDGGREALMEAQRFPADYDGILAGAPAYNWTALVSSGADNEKQLNSSPAAHLSTAKMTLIANSVRATCDAKDGVRDGVLNDPRQCGFDPTSLTCKQGDAANCLLPEQVASLQRIYAAKHDAQGTTIYPGFVPGAEDAHNSWERWITGAQGLTLFFTNGYFSDFVYQRPDWQLQSFDFPRDYALATERTGDALNATDTNLRPFLSRGGRLILYHGFNDPAIPALGTIDYFNRVTAKVGSADAEKGVHLYVVPGMLHCETGPGANDFGQSEEGSTGRDAQHDAVTALEQWVEKGTAPATLIATKFTDDNPAKPVLMTRPLCPYPALPKYIKGDPNDAKSFTCAAPHP